MQWKRDYDNCSRYEDNNDLKAANAVIQSESNRREARLKGKQNQNQKTMAILSNTYQIDIAHFGNDVWTKRKTPPSDWDNTLPEWLQKRNENTLLEVKSRQAKGENIELIGERYLCTIM